VITKPFLADHSLGSDWFHRLRKDQRLTLMVALVSRFNHDLRTPLNTISGWTHLLLQAESDPVQVRRASEVLARNVREETLLLDEFVDDTRVLLDGLNVMPSRVSASELLSAAGDRIAPFLELHGVRLRSRSDADGVMLNVDVVRVTRLVYRLTLAAVRRAPEGGTIEQQVGVTDGHFAIDTDSPTLETTVADAQLLDLQISSALAARTGARLELADPNVRSRFRLLLPLA
jgi:signal transduction histidine kinase